MTGPLIVLGEDGAACQDGFCDLPAPVAPAALRPAPEAAPTKAPAQDGGTEAGQDGASR